MHRSFVDLYVGKVHNYVNDGRLSQHKWRQDGRGSASKVLIGDST